MSAIHQIYCTHCTHGSSALERRQGDLASRTLGYSARAGSLGPGPLRQLFRQVERYLYYQLPRDATADDKLRLNAATAPRRLVFLPSAAGVQLAAQVCYRPTDSEGRPGSYFAHAVVRERGDEPNSPHGDAAWTCLDALRLWQAPGWVEQDGPHIDYTLPSLASLDDLLQGRRPAIDDRVLTSFLAASPGGLDDPCGVVPLRWRERPAAERAGLVRDALAALFETASGQRQSLLLVAEPSLAGVLFYAAARLLPSGGLREGLSFSTYEPNPDRLSTHLAATVFADSQRTDAPPATYRSHTFVFNTFLGRRSDAAGTGLAYADLVLGRLLESGWPAVDAMLAQMQAAGARRLEDLVALAAIERAVPMLLRGGEWPREPAWRASPAATAYFCQALARTLAEVASPETQLGGLVGRQAQMTVLELLAGSDWPRAGPALEFLAQNVPTDRIAELVRLEGIAAERKVDVLARHVAARGELPPGCEWLWDEAAPPSEKGDKSNLCEAPGGPLRGKLDLSPFSGRERLPSQPSVGRSRADEDLLLPRVFARLDGKALERLQRHAPPAYAERFLPALILACRHSAAHAAVLGRAVAAMPEDTLVASLHLHGMELLASYPAGEPALGERLRAVLVGLADHVPQFQARLDVVLGAAHLLPDTSDRQAAAAWERVRRAIVEIGGLRRGDPGALEDACRRMCEAASMAMPAAALPDDAHGARKIHVLRSLGPRLLGHEHLLPPDRVLHRALWQKAQWYFETGRWPTVPLARMRPAGWSMAKTWTVAAIIAAAVAVVAVGVMWGLLHRGAAQGVPQGPPAESGTDALQPAPGPTPQPRAKPVEVAQPPTPPAPGEKPGPAAPPIADAEKQWRRAAAHFAEENSGVLLEDLPMRDGVAWVPAGSVKLAPGEAACLGEGRLTLDGATHTFGKDFLERPPTARHEVPSLADELGLASVSVALEARPRGFALVVVAEPAPQPTDNPAAGPTEMAALADRAAQIAAALSAYEDAASDDATRQKAQAALVALLGDRIAEPLPKPDPQEPRFQDRWDLYRQAIEAHNRSIRARDEALGRLAEIARQEIGALAARVELLRADERRLPGPAGQTPQERIANLKQHCRRVTAVVYPAPGPQTNEKP